MTVAGSSPTTIVICSRDLAPVPLTLTTVPGTPLLKSNLNAANTVILVRRTSLADVEEPEALMVWDPPVALGTSKDVDQTPCESAAILEATVLLSNLTEIPDSKALNPAPLTLIRSPVVASDRSKERVAVTLKEACPVTEDPLAAMNLAPPAAFDGMFRSVNILPSWLALTVN